MFHLYKMKEWVEFRLGFRMIDNEAGRTSRTFTFPTAPFYLGSKYNQKCKVVFTALATDADMSVAESVIDVVFKGTTSNQFRLKKVWAAGDAFVTNEFVQTPLTATLLTHIGTNINNSNFDTSGSNYIICNALWGQSCEIEVRESSAIGFAGADNYAVKYGNQYCELLMRIAPFSEEEECGCDKYKN